MNEGNLYPVDDVLKGEAAFAKDDAQYWRRQKRWPLNRMELVVLGL